MLLITWCVYRNTCCHRCCSSNHISCHCKTWTVICTFRDATYTMLASVFYSFVFGSHRFLPKSSEKLLCVLNGNNNCIVEPFMLFFFVIYAVYHKHPTSRELFLFFWCSCWTVCTKKVSVCGRKEQSLCLVALYLGVFLRVSSSPANLTIGGPLSISVVPLETHGEFGDIPWLIVPSVFLLSVVPDFTMVPSYVSRNVACCLLLYFEGT